MTISVGSTLPDVHVMIWRDGKALPVSTAELFAGKKAVLFAVPGAFTPTCHLKHMPGFIERSAEFKAKGIDFLACTAVNDHHVMAAWGKASGAEGKVELLADGTGAFAKGMGLDSDMGALGVRSRRYAAYIEDGIVRVLHVEEAPGVNVSGADAMLAAIG